MIEMVSNSVIKIQRCFVYLGPLVPWYKSNLRYYLRSVRDSSGLVTKEERYVRINLLTSTLLLIKAARAFLP